MESSIRILKLEKDGHDGVVVTFSDGTWGAYVVEELLELLPHREKVSKAIPKRSETKVSTTKPVS